MTVCRACGQKHADVGADTAPCPRTGEPRGTGPCGTRLDRYEVLEWLGGGGMGAVYRAKHVGLGQHLALKLLRRENAHDAEAVQRLLREAKAAASIPSPHVVQVSDFGVSGEGQPFLVMELLDGIDLDRHMTRKGRLSADEAVGIVLDVLAGLSAAHEAGVVHRDLKAANVLLGKDVVKIVDFGIAKLRADAKLDTLTRTGMAMGTPYSMSPEQAKNAKDVDARTDLWAVGVMLYHALSGQPPFDGTSYEDLIVRICTEEPPSLATVAPDVPAPLVPVVMRCLAKDPAARWATADALATALRQAMREADAAAVPPAERDPEEEEAPREEGPAMRPSLAFADTRPRNAWKLPLALVGFLAAAGGLLWMAIALRPTVAAAPISAQDTPSSVHEVQLGPSTPPSSATPSATPAVAPVSITVELPSAQGVTVTELEVSDPSLLEAAAEHLARILPRLASYREHGVVTARCTAEIDRGGRATANVTGPPLCNGLFGAFTLPRTPASTVVALTLRLEAR
jgi:serine/threonine-protein kinase